ncbi:MAG: twin-arginine translocase TatA/TatE family subunit [Deltaproteobacteria bacterium]|nr:twin-arginine translocase TatA/TatE family subunit [Deltaproteobacteria bacterium]
MPGFAELVFFLIVVLFIFGAGKLPAIATAVGKAIVKMRARNASEEQEAEEDLREDEDGPSV